MEQESQHQRPEWPPHPAGGTCHPGISKGNGPLDTQTDRQTDRQTDSAERWCATLRLHATHSLAQLSIAEDAVYPPGLHEQATECQHKTDVIQPMQHLGGGGGREMKRKEIV